MIGGHKFRITALALFGIATSGLQLRAQAAPEQQTPSATVDQQPTPEQLNEIMHRKGWKVKTLDDARKIFFEEQKQVQERAIEEQRKQDQNIKIGAGLPFLQLVHQAISRLKNPDPVSLKSSLDKFIEANATMHIFPSGNIAHVYDYADNPIQMQPNPIFLMEISSGLDKYVNKDTLDTIDGSQAVVYLLDLLKRAEVDNADVRYDGMVLMKQGLNEGLKRLECNASTPSKFVSQSWRLSNCKVR